MEFILLILGAGLVFGPIIIAVAVFYMIREQSSKQDLHFRQADELLSGVRRDVAEMARRARAQGDAGGAGGTNRRASTRDRGRDGARYNRGAARNGRAA